MNHLLQIKHLGLLRITRFLPRISLRFLSQPRNTDNPNDPNKKSYSDMNNDCRSIFGSAVEAVLPGSMVKDNLTVYDHKLKVGTGKESREYNLSRNVHIVAFGKAVVGMVRAAEEVLGNHVKDGVASIPKDYIDTFKALNKHDLLPNETSKVQFYEGAEKNLPDEDAYHASMKIEQLAERLTENDIMLTLISGGGSSLLTSPKPPITLKELREFSSILSKHGATINQMNTVRKQLEVLKGGGLARLASPAKVVALILSDIIGDPLDLIASGPTCVDYSSPQQCLDLFTQLDVMDHVPASVMTVLNQSVKQHKIKDPRPATLADSQILLSNTLNVVVGSNRRATSGALDKAKELGYLPYVLSNWVNNDADLVGTQYSKIARFICRSMGHKVGKDSTQLMQDEIELVKMGIRKKKVNDLRTLAEKSVNTGKPICVICGGETTVHVHGTGIGGRNQQMALSCALNMHERFHSNDELMAHYRVLFMSAGTDGMDGPCDAAGAMVMPETISQAHAQRLDPHKYLDNNDSYHFFKMLNSGKNHVITGHTGTNVMDVQFLVIQPLLR